MFPEGTRSRDGRIQPFKPGFALLARKAAVPVVPVVIDGAFDAWPRTWPVPRPLVPIYVVYGEPFYPDHYRDIAPEEFVRRLYERMVRLQHELRRHVGRTPYVYED